MNLFPVRSIRETFVMTMALGLLVGLFAACGGTDPSLPPATNDQTDTQRLDHDDYDGVTPLRARTDGLVLSVKPLASFEQTAFGHRWHLAFEANQPLSSVLSWGSGGELGQARMQDDYHFEISLDASEVHHLLSGASLYLMLMPAEGDRRVFDGMVHLAPRFFEPEGSLLVWLDPAIERVEHHGAVWLRGVATTAEKIVGLSVEAATGATPAAVAYDDGDRWTMEWDVAAMRTALSMPDEPVLVIGTDDAGARYQVSADLHLVVDELGLTTGDAEQTWPATR